MQFQITLLFIVATINSLLSLFVLLGKRDRTNVIYSLFVLFASFWAIGLAFFIMETDFSLAIYIADFYYVSALGIPTLFLYFSLVFLNKDFKPYNKNLPIFLPIVILICSFILDKNILIQKVFFTDWGKDVVINHTNYIIYGIFFVMFVVFSFFNLFKSYLSKTNPEEKNQLKFVLIGTSIGFLFGMVFDLILPFVGDYKHIFIGPIFSLFMVASVAYAITKYKMFNMKVIVTQMFMIILWVSILIRALIANTLQEQIIDVVLLLATIIIGIFLIRSVLKEVEQREKIENLAKDLERVNADLAKANDRLKELDQLKSEFLSLATHQIRAPLTAIKGYASLILEGDYGEVSEPVKKTIRTIFDSCQNLVIIVGEFLDISRIEQGRMKYDLTDFDITATVSEVINELSPNIKNAGLTINLEPSPSYIVKADIGKIKQIINNIIDNSIKYTKNGGIKISILDDNKNVKIAISDTGIGITSEDIPKLFTKFSRAKDAFKTNVVGTGLGLYVAKQMVEAQGGKIWVESPGVGRGSTFFIELPKKQ